MGGRVVDDREKNLVRLERVCGLVGWMGVVVLKIREDLKDIVE